MEVDMLGYCIKCISVLFVFELEWYVFVSYMGMMII